MMWLRFRHCFKCIHSESQSLTDTVKWVKSQIGEAGTETKHAGSLPLLRALPHAKCHPRDTACPKGGGGTELGGGGCHKHWDIPFTYKHGRRHRVRRGMSPEAVRSFFYRLLLVEHHILSSCLAHLASAQCAIMSPHPLPHTHIQSNTSLPSLLWMLSRSPDMLAPPS